MKALNAEDRHKFKTAIDKGYIDPMHPDFHTFCGAYIRKYPKRTSILDRFKHVLGREPQWDDITDDVVRDFVYELRNDGLAPNSIRTVCAELKALLNANRVSKKIESEDFCKILTTKKVPSQGVYLTSTELSRIHNYIPTRKNEIFVKEIFMRECLTGARNVDCRRMSMANIIEINGLEFIRYVPQKHPITVTVPVHKWLKDYLTGEFTPSQLNMDMDDFNDTLRKICAKCHIDEEVTTYKAGQSETGPKYQFIASHTGRRTFATLLSLKGCQIEQIAQMMGHMSGNVPNITMTAGYILAQRKISKTTYSYFQ